MNSSTSSHDSWSCLWIAYRFLPNLVHKFKSKLITYILYVEDDITSKELHARKNFQE